VRAYNINKRTKFKKELTRRLRMIPKSELTVKDKVVVIGALAVPVVV